MYWLFEVVIEFWVDECYLIDLIELSVSLNVKGVKYKD
jgi:hypothetical protein